MSNNNKPAFELKKPTNSALFKPSADSVLVSMSGNIVNIGTDKLKHYHNHPFKLYKGERLNDMIESIEANGILIPLLVRPLPTTDNSEQHYEVLAGHNRLESGKIAGLSEVPCIIKEGLTDEEAHLIVTESNLVQRSFSDLSHSERAEALATHYNAIKHQGKRTDLIREVEALINGEITDNSEIAHDSEDETNTLTGNKSIEVTGEKYGLSRNSVARYIRLNDLIPEIKEYLDSEELSIRAGVALSYLNKKRQQIVYENMQKWQKCPSMKQAEELKRLNAKYTADTEMGDEAFPLHCTDLLLGLNAYAKEQKPQKTIKLNLKRSEVQSYFKEDDTEETIQETILEALQFFHQHRGQFDDSQK